MSDISALISGFRIFKATEYTKYKDLIGHLIQLDSKPKTLVIACCDMRMAPGRILSSNPGDLYVVRNIGGFIPPYKTDNQNSTIAAIDYAIKDLDIENIIVFGHKNCDAIKLLMEGDEKTVSGPMQNWLDIAKDAKNAVVTQMENSTPKEKEEACAREAILVSLKNLLTYPLVDESIAKDKVKLFGWQIDMMNGDLYSFDPIAGVFETID